uniref:Ribosomal protein L15 n=1 Tax=Angiostrongylus cantonensis TaxID=6313 RepID=A0A0K0D397_ANGCA
MMKSRIMIGTERCAKTAYEKAPGQWHEAIKKQRHFPNSRRKSFDRYKVKHDRLVRRGEKSHAIMRRGTNGLGMGGDEGMSRPAQPNKEWSEKFYILRCELHDETFVLSFSIKWLP